MNFVKLFLNVNHKNYSYDDASNIEMSNLGLFLSSDVRCYNSNYKEWALADKSDPKSGYTWSFGGNITFMEEEEDGFIYLRSSLPLEEDEVRVYFKLSKEQFVKILDDWEELVCKKKPQEVTIKHINDEFIFETKQ